MQRDKGKGRRASNPLKVVAGLGVAGALVLGGGFVWLGNVGNRASALGGGPLPAALRKPVLTARRTPDVLSFVTRTSKVKRALAATTAMLPEGSCIDVRWLGAPLASVRTTSPLVPGSTAKIVTASVALDVLGADTVFTTRILATKNPDGSIADLFFVGGGDPLLVRSEYVASEKYQTFNQTSMEALADSIVNAGIRSVSGRVIGVDSYFDAERWVPEWPSDFRYTEAGPLGALMVNDGAVIGQPMKPDDPAVAAATELVNLLTQRGVQVAGGAAHDVVSDGAVEITSSTSAKLSSVLQEMLVNSDNNTAEIILKHIGLKGKGTGSTAAGLQVIAERLKSWGTGSSVVLKDGSGLSSLDRISCSDLQDILDRERSRLPGSMAIAGETGTLRESFDGTAMKGVLRAKTGTLSGVKALAGYVPLDGDDPVRFALLLNRQGIDNRSAYRPIWKSLADALSTASSSPRPTELAP